MEVHAVASPRIVAYSCEIAVILPPAMVADGCDAVGRAVRRRPDDIRLADEIEDVAVGDLKHVGGQVDAIETVVPVNRQNIMAASLEGPSYGSSARE